MCLVVDKPRWVEWVLRYLKGTTTLGLLFKAGECVKWNGANNMCHALYAEADFLIGKVVGTSVIKVKMKMIGMSRFRG